MGILTKILPAEALAQAAADWRRDGAVVVLAAGCFDPTHYGHVQYLEAARRMGNVLVVSVASDFRVREAKGMDRPRSPAAHRAGVVAALSYVDAVTVCDAGDVVPVIKAIRPHVYVKGAEYRTKKTMALSVEVIEVQRYGGRVEFLSGPVVCSSTALLAGV